MSYLIYIIICSILTRCEMISHVDIYDCRSYGRTVPAKWLCRTTMQYCHWPISTSQLTLYSLLKTMTYTASAHDCWPFQRFLFPTLTMWYLASWRRLWCQRLQPTASHWYVVTLVRFITMSVGMGRIFESVCLSVRPCVCVLSAA